MMLAPIPALLKRQISSTDRGNRQPIFFCQRPVGWLKRLHPLIADLSGGPQQVAWRFRMLRKTPPAQGLSKMTHIVLSLLLTKNASRQSMLELGPIEKDTHGLGPAFPKHPISRRGIQRRGAMGDQIGNAPLPALKRHNSSMISSMIKSSEVKMEGR